MKAFFPPLWCVWTKSSPVTFEEISFEEISCEEIYFKEISFEVDFIQKYFSHRDIF